VEAEEDGEPEDWAVVLAWDATAEGTGDVALDVVAESLGEEVAVETGSSKVVVVALEIGRDHPLTIVRAEATISKGITTSGTRETARDLDRIRATSKPLNSNNSFGARATKMDKAITTVTKEVVVEDETSEGDVTERTDGTDCGTAIP